MFTTLLSIIVCALLFSIAYYLIRQIFRDERQFKFRHDFREWHGTQSKITFVRFEHLTAIVRLKHRNNEEVRVIKMNDKWVILRK